MPQNFNNEEYNIIVEKYEVYGDYQIKDNIERLSTFIFSSDNKDDDDIHIPSTRNYDRLYGIIFLWDLKQFTAMPYVRINNEGMKEYGFKPKAV